MKNEINIVINIETNISFWQALKLRIAGIKCIQEYIKQKLNEEIKLN